MTLTDRDKKVLTLLAFVGLIAGFWYFVYKPKKAEIATLATKTQKAERRLDNAEQRLARFVAARASYAADYSEVVRLGKAIPDASEKDAGLASLIVQIDSLAKHAAKFTSFNVEEFPPGLLEPSLVPEGVPVPSGSAAGPEPAAAGTGTGSGGTKGAPAKTDQSGSAQSFPFRPLRLRIQLEGSFLKLHRVFAAMNDLVELSKTGAIKVNGRLILVQGFSVKQAPQGFPTVDVNIGGIIYALPNDQTVTEGATPKAPAQNGPEPVSSGGSQPSGATPSATATPAKP